MADNASITILRNTQANINAEPIKDGNILFTTDQPSNEIYADVGAKRIKIGGGKGISNISKTSTSGLVDTYTIAYNDGTTSTFEVTNGEGLQNLQVGGRNLITDSEGEFSSNYPDADGDITDIIQRVDCPLPAYATQFVMSFEAKSTVAGDIIHSFFYNPSNIIRTVNSDGVVSDSPDGNIYTTLTTEWKRYWVKWTAPIANARSIITARLANGEGTGTVSIRNIKFETGNTPTDWTPALEDMFDIVRPVGSLYSTTDASFNPNTAKGWHGTWERIKDCVIYAAGDSDTVGVIVGSNTHTLTEAELPSHSHSIPALSGSTSNTQLSYNFVHLTNQNFGYGFLQNGVPLGTADGYPATSSDSTRHTHTVTTEASTTGASGSSSSIDIRPRRLNSVVWRRTA